MRILHVISALAAGGAESLVRDLSISLRGREIEVGVAYLSSAKDQQSSSDYEAAYLASLRQNGIASFEIGHRARKNMVFGALQLRLIVKEFRPDVVHVHLATGLIMRGLGLLGVPTVYTHHSLVFTFPKILFKFFDQFVSEYVAICEICRKELFAVTHRPVCLIRNAVSEARIATRQVKLPSSHIKVLSVGGITIWKDYPTLIEVAAVVQKNLFQHGKHVEFQIAGDGGALLEMQNLARTRGVDDFVIFLGARKDVPQLMANADLLLMTSISEGLPMTLVEAIHTGLPVVATDVGGCSEVIVDGENGFLAEPRDVQAIAEKLLRILLDPKLAKTMGEKAKIHAKEFGLDVCSQKHLELYARVSKSQIS